eukprot:TRINITY_DN2559_c0_g1_i7.p1 TRINITY_DN2559_c0_g1~~TRINITY_DN2559_c0_g1_i7.p1  ORF type:complete len:216 (+),score=39.83 TRINITY_DN2559_c0_g1_i7:477-1124(+)
MYLAHYNGFIFIRTCMSIYRYTTYVFRRQIRLEHEQLVRNDTYPDELQDSWSWSLGSSGINAEYGHYNGFIFIRTCMSIYRYTKLVRNDTYPDELQDRLVGLGLLIWKLFATNGCPLDYTASLVKEKIISAGRRVGGGNQAENEKNRILFPIKVHPSVEKIVNDCWEMKPTCQIYTTIKEQLYSFLLPALPTPPFHLEICVQDLLQELGADPGSR